MLLARTVRRCLILVALVGCGPVQSTSLIVDAQAELAAARTAQAEELSPFEFVAAEAYLAKAREEQSYSDFEIAVDYAQRSLDCARVARMRAEAATREALGTSRPTMATRAKCRPGPARAVPAPDEEPAAARRARAQSVPKKDPKEPDDPAPAPAPPPPPPPEPELPEGDLPDGDGDAEADDTPPEGDG